MNACTAPDRANPSTSAQSVSQNMKNASSSPCQRPPKTLTKPAPFLHRGLIGWPAKVYPGSAPSARPYGYTDIILAPGPSPLGACASCCCNELVLRPAVLRGVVVRGPVLVGLVLTGCSSGTRSGGPAMMSPGSQYHSSRLTCAAPS